MSSPLPQENAQHSKAKQRAIALAALTQVTCLVQTIAQQGKCDQQQFETCLDALLADDYTHPHTFAAGSIKIKRLLQGQEVNHTKYILSHASTLMSIEKKLAKQPQKLENIAEGMLRIQKQITFFDSPYHPNIIAAIAHLYGDNISNIKPQVVVRGKPEHLKLMENKEKIRCLLFSGIRAAWVWRNHGGHALHLVFGRKKIIHELEKIRKTG